MSDDVPVLACRLDALDRDEQARRAGLAEDVTHAFLEVAFEPQADVMWLRFGGGPGVKAFLDAAGVTARLPRVDSSSGC